MKFSSKVKNILFTVLLMAAAVCVSVFWLFDGNTEHIEDTNGKDDFTLQEITDENIISLDTGAVGGPNEEIDSITNTVTYSSGKYTGVSEIFGKNIVANRFEITVNHTAVSKGNFRLVLLCNDKIVHDFTLNELTQTFVLEDVSGYVSLRIAGESADFTFDYYLP